MTICSYFFQDWSLKILRVRPEDTGLYKCQANSHPPQFITIQLKVEGKRADFSTHAHVCGFELLSKRCNVIKLRACLHTRLLLLIRNHFECWQFWKYQPEMAGTLRRESDNPNMRCSDEPRLKERQKCQCRMSPRHAPSEAGVPVQRNVVLWLCSFCSIRSPKVLTFEFESDCYIIFLVHL